MSGCKRANAIEFSGLVPNPSSAEFPKRQDIPASFGPTLGPMLSSTLNNFSL
jgi:hypothetical protein